jgi:hypothetical protein
MGEREWGGVPQNTIMKSGIPRRFAIKGLAERIPACAM